MSRLDELKARPLREVARVLGYTVGRKGIAPCPACGEERRGGSDKRAPVGITRDGGGWRCWSCDARGGRTDLVARSLGWDGAPGAGDPRWGDLWEECKRRGLIDGDGPTTRAHRRRPLNQGAPAPFRLNQGEVRALWGAANHTGIGNRGRAWFWARGIEPCAVAPLDLARILPRGAECPSWARCGRATWAENRPILMPCYDHRGEMVALRGRWAGVKLVDGQWVEVKPRGPKVASPVGSGACAGTVYADPVGQWLLRSGRDARKGAKPVPKAPEMTWNGQVLIVEGGPAFLKYATAEGRVGDDFSTMAVFGVWSGSWPDDHLGDQLAGRFPLGESGAGVVIATDADDAGDKYARQIGATLARAGVPYKRVGGRNGAG